MTVVVDKLLKTLKIQIVDSYNAYTKKLRKGYPLKGYELIVDSIQAVDFIQNNVVEDELKTKILEHHIVSLKDAR